MISNLAKVSKWAMQILFCAFLEQHYSNTTTIQTTRSALGNNNQAELKRRCNKHKYFEVRNVTTFLGLHNDQDARSSTYSFSNGPRLNDVCTMYAHMPVYKFH
jgi:hypothetical protein